jgi:hypothetical protein
MNFAASWATTSDLGQQTAKASKAVYEKRQRDQKTGQFVSGVSDHESEEDYFARMAQG